MLYQIKVKPGSSQEKVVQNDDGTLTVYLRAKPHDGEANTVLIKILAKYFDVPKTTIMIKSGAKGRLKTVEF
ncbi:MAG: DUF167 domain-containing protein [Candidatus Saccharibacteria bacterium]|nr:DUF167 domain-containing protein [Candidatus Saccharibacteria bacterium]